jgi:hypothetical protein
LIPYITYYEYFNCFKVHIQKLLLVDKSETSTSKVHNIFTLISYAKQFIFHFYNEVDNLNSSPWDQIEIYVHSNEASNHNTHAKFNLWHKNWATLPCIYPWWINSLAHLQSSTKIHFVWTNMFLSKVLCVCKRYIVLGCWVPWFALVQCVV